MSNSTSLVAGFLLPAGVPVCGDSAWTVPRVRAAAVTLLVTRASCRTKPSSLIKWFVLWLFCEGCSVCSTVLVSSFLSFTPAFCHAAGVLRRSLPLLRYCLLSSILSNLYRAASWSFLPVHDLGHDALGHPDDCSCRPLPRGKPSTVSGVLLHAE